MTSFTHASVARLGEREYGDFLLASIESARRRVWASLFILDVRPGRDLAGLVLEVVHALAERRRRGVDVRVLLNGWTRTPDIAVANLASGITLSAYGVPHRRIFGTGDGSRRGSHAKLALLDDVAIVGSQNWTDDAFRQNLEDAVLLTGAPVDQLGGEFLRLWALGRRMPSRAAA